MANRRTRRSISLSIFRPPDANEASGRPVRSVVRAICYSCVERSQADRIAVEVGDDFSVRMRFERDLTAQPSGNGRWRGPSHALWFGIAQAWDDLQVWG